MPVFFPIFFFFNKNLSEYKFGLFHKNSRTPFSKFLKVSMEPTQEQVQKNNKDFASSRSTTKSTKSSGPLISTTLELRGPEFAEHSFKIIE